MQDTTTFTSPTITPPMAEDASRQTPLPRRGTLRIVVSRGGAPRKSEIRRDRREDRIVIDRSGVSAATLPRSA